MQNAPPENNQTAHPEEEVVIETAREPGAIGPSPEGQSTEPQEASPTRDPEQTLPDDQSDSQSDDFYYIRFRQGDPAYSGVSRISDLAKGEVVMAQAEHGLEPAIITGHGPDMSELPEKKSSRATYLITRRANRDEISKFERLKEREEEAFTICQTHIGKHKLNMKLTRVERYFNGSKIIFYFTAENRVDFRELVKDLVQEFRTRVEIRQIGVRHETKMVGGLGCCGRELCCSSFIKEFSPVSIKMAKAQNLPLNPAKISGVCNRLLCCLTYEYETYRKLRKGMPKVGKAIVLSGKEFKVINSDILAETITVVIPGQPDPPKVLTKAEWSPSEPPPRQQEVPPKEDKVKEQQPRKKGRHGKEQWSKNKKKDPNSRQTKE